MKKMTVRKMLENIVVKTAGLDVKKFYLVSMDGEVVTADFAVDLSARSRRGMSCGKSRSWPRSITKTSSL